MSSGTCLVECWTMFRHVFWYWRSHIYLLYCRARRWHLNLEAYFFYWQMSGRWSSPLSPGCAFYNARLTSNGRIADTEKLWSDQRSCFHMISKLEHVKVVLRTCALCACASKCGKELVRKDKEPSKSSYRFCIITEIIIKQRPHFWK
jgi:hypothetical protein